MGKPINCSACGGQTTKVKEVKKAKYRDEIVAVETELYRCDLCQEGFVTADQMRAHARAVKNQVRKMHGLLPPERIVAIREKLRLTQTELENVLGTGPKVIVRWESGKVIQSRGHDNVLRLLDRNPAVLKLLRQIQECRSKEQDSYSEAQPERKAAARA
ncbi:MAG: type II TA system antitoxin MqsA family protein [Candidatus Sulfotelmatobacter sp.]